MTERNIEDELVNWELYKAYGHFNLCFEAVVATFRQFLIDMLRLSYGFDVDWEDPETEDEVASHLQDRLIKIILHDDGANAIIEKCRSCFIDLANPEMKKVLFENEINVPNISSGILLIGEELFKKGLELVRLRNVLIHSHYEGVVYNLVPLRKLEGSKDARTSKGYELRKYEFTTEFLNKAIADMEELEYYTRKLNYIIKSDSEDLNFEADALSTIGNLKFSPLKK